MIRNFIPKLVLMMVLSLVALVSKQNSMMDIDGLKFQMESQHFEFHCENADKECLEDLSIALEENYKRIVVDLNTTLKNKTRVLVYPDIISFHKAYGNPNAPNGIVGAAYGDEIMMVSPLNPGGVYNYKELLKVIVHEFTHIVISDINTNASQIPLWINEGVAMYEADQLHDKSLIFLKESVKKNKILTLRELESFKLNEVEEFIQKGGYQFSYSIVDFIIEKFGRDKLVNLIKRPFDFENTFGISKSDFEKQWVLYLKIKYVE